MNGEAIVTFVVIAGIVWGGFIFLVSKALRSERFKAAESAAQEPEAAGPAPGGE